MIEEVQIFNKKNNYLKIKINPENPYLMITRIEIPSIPKFSNNIYGLSPQFILTCLSFDSNKRSTTDQIHGVTDFLNPQLKEAKFIVNKVIVNDPSKEFLELKYDVTGEIDADVHVFYTQLNQILDLTALNTNFKQHIEKLDNVKILFSAPFGQGKTTFLNNYFEENSDKYEVYKLYPVNYAVSHNEDIFKYIKAEILFQLLGKNVDFEKVSFDYLDASIEYFRKNINEIISPLLKLIPKVGHSASTIFDKLYSLAENIKKHKASIEIKDKQKAIDYIHELYEKEGSIFEDNFYTQLIRQLLEELKQNQKKQNVLIIDDLDRMDPDHIFRIFNVLSANFDSSKYLEGYTNKFGFDKIILVCDYNNIKSIFKHRYGKYVDFAGYLNKYFSIAPYHYDNSTETYAITNALTQYNGQPVQSSIGFLLVNIIDDLVKTGQLTLRDLLKFQKNNLYDFINKLTNEYSNTLQINKSKLIFFNIIAYLNSKIDIDTLIEKFNNCKLKVKNKENFRYDHYVKLGLIPFVKGQIFPNIEYTVNLNGANYSFKIGHANEINLHYDYYETIEFKSSTHANYYFVESHFYDVLIKNAELYKTL